MREPETVLVTGATGLIGANVCVQLVERGTHVRALVRPGSEMAPLADLGVELVEGDLTSTDDLLRGAKGCDAIVNSAAVLGGASQDRAEQRATNVGGAANAYDAGAATGARVVELSTTTFLNVACEVAGVDHRVEDERVDPDDPAMLERYGPSLVALAGRRYPVPWFRNDHTRAVLGYEPITLRDGMSRTIDWLRRVG